MSILLSPAGDLEKLKYAVNYGADAVYLAGRNFGMRARAGNFSDDDMLKGIEYAHSKKVKVYVTLNIAARNDDVLPMLEYAKKLNDFKVDGLIISDLGILCSIKEMLPNMFITLSTQANTTNYKSVEYWSRLGVNRIVLARELSYDEIKKICELKPKEMQIEIFVHGAMCMSYSGRCLISNYLANRDSNRGDCAQPCRWKYRLTEETRPDENFSIEQDDNGSYFFNSKDLCLIARMKELTNIEIDAFKIEGRMKSNYYVACVTGAYKEALRRCSIDSEYKWKDLYDELCKVSHREYTEAFYDNSEENIFQNYNYGGYERDYVFTAQVLEDTDSSGLTKISQRNKFCKGDRLEFIRPGCIGGEFVISSIYNDKMLVRDDAPHAAETLYIKTEGVTLKKHDLIRQVRR